MANQAFALEADWAKELNTPSIPLSAYSTSGETEVEPVRTDPDTDPGKTQPAPHTPAPDPSHNPDGDDDQPCKGPCRW